MARSGNESERLAAVQPGADAATDKTHDKTDDKATDKTKSETPPEPEAPQQDVRAATEHDALAREASAETASAEASDLTARETTPGYPAEEPAKEPAGASVPAGGGTAGETPPVAPSRRGGVLALLGGGMAAALIGAGAVLLLLPQGWDRQAHTVMQDRIAALESAAQQGEAQLVARIDALEGGLAGIDAEALAQRVEALQTRLDSTLAAAESSSDGAQLQALEQRVAALESGADNRIQAAIDAAMASFRAQLREDGASQAEAAAEAQQAIEAAAQALALRTSLDALAAAAETGDSAPEALAALGEWRDPPAALAPIATGLPSLGDLRQSFPAAARAALAAAPLPADAPARDRLLGFLRSQTGARSLAPRDGMDTDAILSRAEARLREGDLAGSLHELDGLAAEPASEMVDWRNAAQTRLEALEALAVLRAELDEG